MTIEREAKVPMPNGETAVSPNRTETSSGSMPSSSQAIWAKVVSIPWPWLWIATSRCIVPSECILAVAVS